MPYPDLSDVVAAIVEAMAFLTPREPGEEVLAAAERVVGIRFSERAAPPAGSRSGEMVLGLSPGLSAVIACNMLGMPADAPVPEETIRDATCELMNVLAGNLLPRLVGSNREFILSTPFQRSALPDPGVLLCSFPTEEGLLVVMLTADLPA